MAWKFNGTEAVSLQIARILRDDILNLKYQPDEQIPSVRQIAQEAAVNPNTVQKALTLLEEEGLLYVKGTVGRFVTSDTRLIDAAREKNRRLSAQKWLSEARALGLTTEEMISYIMKQEKENEYLGS